MLSSIFHFGEKANFHFLNNDTHRNSIIDISISKVHKVDKTVFTANTPTLLSICSNHLTREIAMKASFDIAIFR